jgi:hypothetical protein
VLSRPTSGPVPVVRARPRLEHLRGGVGLADESDDQRRSASKIEVRRVRLAGSSHRAAPELGFELGGFTILELNRVRCQTSASVAAAISTGTAGPRP